MNAEEGRRYRRIVLEKEGGEPEMKFLEEFVGGRPLNGTAFSNALRE